MFIYISDFGIPAWPLGVLTLLILLPILWDRKHNYSYLLFFSIFWIYLIFGIDKVFFPIEVSGIFADSMRQRPILSSVNLIPFYFGQYGLTARGLTSYAYNILLTLPFGFGLNFITRVYFKALPKISVIIGLGIEFIQLIISLLLRYPYRVIDINDSLFNIIGILIGYGLFKVFARMYLKMTQRSKAEHVGLWL